MPTSVSGYSLCATQGDFIDEENDDPLNESTNNNYVQDQLTAFTNSTRQQKLRQSVIYNQKNELKYSDNQNQIGSGSTMNSKAAGMAMSASNYSMSSGMQIKQGLFTDNLSLKAIFHYLAIEFDHKV